MAINVSAVLTFAVFPEWESAYRVEDGGIRLHFVCANPGPGQVSDYFVLLTDAELSSVSSQGQLRSLVESKLKRSLRATGIASKLDQFIGQSVTI